jgi:hypothetical protein
MGEGIPCIVTIRPVPPSRSTTSEIARHIEVVLSSTELSPVMIELILISSYNQCTCLNKTSDQESIIFRRRG